MADLNQVRILMEGADVWNQWRSENPETLIDLRNADLRDAELPGANLREANLSSANLRDAILDNADLIRGSLEHAKLNGTKARGALFNGAVMKGAQMNNLIARNANFIEADLSNCSFIQAMLLGANMTKAICRDANLNNSELGDCNLTQTDFRDSKLQKASFTGASLIMTDLRRCELNKATFKKANLSGADLRRAQLKSADFLGARLLRTDLREALGLTCEQLNKGRDWKTAYRDEALACGAEIPVPDGGVTIEVPTSHFRLTGHPPTVTTAEESDEALPVTSAKAVRVETAEEIDEVTSIRFNKAPATVVEEATRAKNITIALQVFLRDLRLNTPEAAEAQSLLDEQVNKLDLIITKLQSDDDKQAAQNTFRDLLQDVFETYVKVLAEEGTTRGILAAAAIALLSVAGVDVGVVVGTLVGGSIVGVDAKALKNILKGWKTKNKRH